MIQLFSYFTLIFKLVDQLTIKLFFFASSKKIDYTNIMLIVSSRVSRIWYKLLYSYSALSFQTGLQLMCILSEHFVRVCSGRLTIFRELLMPWYYVWRRYVFVVK
jgi:hypothetical protein